MARHKVSLSQDTIPEPVRRGLAFVARALFELDEAKLSPPRRLVVFVLRLFWLVVRGFFRDRIQMRAASLAFGTILAFVPLAALSFAIADALGELMDGSSAPVHALALKTYTPESWAKTQK